MMTITLDNKEIENAIRIYLDGQIIRSPSFAANCSFTWYWSVQDGAPWKLELDVKAKEQK